jgi:nucleoside-diphosphate-sugar epimerase
VKKVLLIGGAGNVGTAVTPYIAKQYDIRVLDVQRPKHDVDWIEGSIADPNAVRSALTGVDTFVNLAMRGGQGGYTTDQTTQQILDNYEINTLGLHLLLFNAHELGVMGGVHTSTMSVHYRARRWFPAEETVPLDSPSVYGFTKGLGEQICEYFARWFDMNIVALRITGPRARAQFLAERADPPVYAHDTHLYVTDEEDLARAYLTAIETVSVGHGRFDAFFIAGDEDEHEHNLSKAQRILKWEPKSHLLLEDGEDSLSPS